jgi:hypothetical protein
MKMIDKSLTKLTKRKRTQTNNIREKGLLQWVPLKSRRPLGNMLKTGIPIRIPISWKSRRNKF